ncbi:MAG: oxidoreductase [Flavobacteriaceae bacterium]|nr:oxidoreductase [Flavobacteriaceae bacterium]
MRLLTILLLCSTVLSAQKIQLLKTGSDASFRGLSVVDDSVLWVSGTKGSVGRSLNGGRTWTFTQVPKFEKMDFRDIEAFNDSTAVIVAASTPAYILRTADGGETWKEVYKNADPKIFFDGMDFWDDRYGLAFSDPIDGRLVMVETRTGGATWQVLPSFICPPVHDSEVGFAASGTTIRCVKPNLVFISTGGKSSRVFMSSDFGRTWSFYNTPMLQGKPSQGIFSIAMANMNQGIIVGGDYTQEKDTVANAFATRDGGKNWKRCSRPPAGYRSCVEFIDKKRALCTGPTGTEISPDLGNSWKLISTEGFHASRKAKNGKTVFLCGGNGKVAKVVEEKPASLVRPQPQPMKPIKKK